MVLEGDLPLTESKKKKTLHSSSNESSGVLLRSDMKGNGRCHSPDLSQDQWACSWSRQINVRERIFAIYGKTHFSVYWTNIVMAPGVESDVTAPSAFLCWPDRSCLQLLLFVITNLLCSAFRTVCLRPFWHCVTNNKQQWTDVREGCSSNLCFFKGFWLVALYSDQQKTSYTVAFWDISFSIWNCDWPIWSLRKYFKWW